MTDQTPDRPDEPVGRAARIEEEVLGEERDPTTEPEPWDPALIRVDPKTFSLRQIVDMIDDQEIDLAPEFQRHRVWKPLQKSRLIESILLRIPLPAFYFSADNEGRMQVVDGLQRLSTVHAFAKDEFGLDGLEYLSRELGGKKYSGLKGTVWGRRFQTTQIIVNVIDPQTPPQVKFDIFRRINTLGEPLTAQEIRHCMSQRRSRAFLAQCANAPEFIAATDGAFQDHPRMADREAVLRFCAFKMLPSLDEYARFESMDVFLTEATETIDRVLSDSELTALREALVRAMSNAELLFDGYAFRKWPLSDDRKNPINKPLLEAWSVGLADRSADDLGARRDAIVDAAREAMTTDVEFVDAITVATGDPRKVRIRFLTVREILDRAGTEQPLRRAKELGDLR